MTTVKIVNKSTVPVNASEKFKGKNQLPIRVQNFKTNKKGVDESKAREAK